MHPNHLHATPPAGRRRGFTAIELSAVATIIAILVLVLIPVLSKRVEESKIVAAQDDMRSIEQAQSMVISYTGYYARLQDLTRPAPGENETQAQLDAKLPNATWNIPENDAIRTNFIQNWKGPYGAFHRSRTMFELIESRPDMFRTPSGAIPRVAQQPAEGPILVLPQDDIDERGTAALDRARYPIDPWGNPYVFFGTGRIGTFGGQLPPETQGNESDFNSAIVYSLGPNGAPGNSLTLITDSAAYYRESGVIGAGDDIYREF